MSEPKLISPMLDNFDMGGPISDHDGVRCCPAMRINSDDKYIVKIISVPASEAKFDALLLTGAYPDRSSALAYFKELASGIADEKKILDNLAQLEGFVPFEDCQIVPMDEAAGYDVYLLSEYRLTLERQNSRAPMTQLAAVNLGLDLCAALSVCRRSGYMCVDLKPSNIYIVGDKEYRIGDLGFVRLNYLKYESLPDKYRSCYTAPEVEDPLATLNDTMDIYSVGLILYQVFNGGVLPFDGKYAPGEKFEAPVCADEEMAQIILKACDPDPAERWQDPVQMGQALVNYMQKNGVSDTPLTVKDVPVQTTVDDAEEPAAPTANTEIADAVQTEETPDLSELSEPSEEPEATVSVETPQPDPDAEAASDDPSCVEEILPDASTAVEESPAVESEKTNAESLSGPNPEVDIPPEEVEYDNLSFLDDWDVESSQVLADMDDAYEGITDEVSGILDQIDSLAAHPVPDPVVAPEPIEIKIPDPIPIEEPADSPEETSDDAEPDEGHEDADIELPEDELPYIPKKKHAGLICGIILLIVLALGVGGYFFYTQYYLQPIHALAVSGSEDTLQVALAADIDESQLTIVCADPHGNKVSAPVVNGIAVFSGLTPDTAYTVSVEVAGFHKLTGATSKVYSTPVQTKISQISAITGSESGSVILSFTVEGPDSEQWNVIYNAEGEAERVTAFPAHMVTLAGLTVGKEYTFRLEPVDDIYISGETEIAYVVRNLVCAENLHVTACIDGTLTVQWDTPEGESVTEWSVRCYNESGFDETIVTTEQTATFQGVDDSVENIVEVTAAGMSVNQRTVVVANSVTISDFAVDASNAGMLSLSWQANRDIPAEGWTIRYTVDGISASAAITTDENAAKIPVVPNGHYVFTITDGTGNTALGGPFTYLQPEAAVFNAFNIAPGNLTARLCKTPSASNWTYEDLEDEDYSNTFVEGEKISMVIALSGSTTRSDDTVLTTFAVYDANGALVSYSHSSQSWRSMWDQNYCELDIPGVPAEVGTYEVILYFDGAEAASQKFEITA